MSTATHELPRPDVSFGVLTTDAWRIYKAHWKLLVPCFLTIVAAWVVLELLVARIDVALMNVLFHVLFLIVFGGLQTGFLKIALELYDGRTPEYGTMFRHLTLGPGFFLAQLITTLLVMVGLVALIAPGLYFGSKYGLFGPCIADRGVGGLEAMNQAARLAAGRQMELALLGVFLAVLNFFGAVFLGVGLLLTVPMTYVIVAGAYRRLAGASSAS